MDQPLVSVIIPAYNASAFIAETLESILAQTYRNLEIIVVDDGSTDTTAEIVKYYAPRVKYLYQENSGSCAAPRNYGLKEAKGEFVTFFDADDIMLPHKITSQVEALIAEPTAVMSVTNYRNFSESERSTDHFSTCLKLKAIIDPSIKGGIFLPPEQCRAILIDENFTIASAPLFRRDTLNELGGFHESLTACEDFHLIYRAATLGGATVSAKVGFERRLHDLNMSSDNERMIKNLIKSRLDLINYELEQRLQDRLRKRVQRYRRDLQACLVNKSRLYDAAKLYPQTFPPKSFSDLNHDVRQGLKALWQYTTNGGSQEKTR
ncbi:glycosyl transferase family 2 [Marinobacter pelagius]|uniref:Glycosyl transferase family 2 n=1 Tax=Marinobacter pelagius TaxID=379482 RepID=A0A366GH33_9GAMM|nr:glycosyltransferase family 2 protein [Marinobacter pelagius]RBP25692.1 glycosyl transferase family 2 [Marinobacter pelagius]